MKNLSEALDELDNNFRVVSDYGNEYLGKYGGKNGQILPVQLEDIRAFLKSTLISLLDEVVPDVTGYAVMSDKIEDKDAPGYEACRAELIKRINEVKL